jgi:excisionase family DNA binding protein
MLFYNRGGVVDEGLKMDQEEFMTTKEVAQYLRVDEYTIYRLVSQKKIPAFKIGNQWRFKRSLLEHWLKTKMNIPSSH